MAHLKLSIAHQIPGRIRLKIPSGKGNPVLLEQIKDTFGAIPGIEEITVNPITGSVVLHYDVDRHDQVQGSLAGGPGNVAPVLYRAPTSQIDEMSDKIAQEAAFLAEHSHAARMVVDFFKGLDRQIKVATHNTVDFKIVLAIVVAGFTIFEIGASAATPVWVTLIVFGVNHFIEMHQGVGVPARRLSVAAPA